MNITYPEIVFLVLSSQNAMRMRHIVICGRPSRSTIFFSTLPTRRHVCLKEVTEYRKCVSICSTTFFWNSFHSKKKWVRYDEKCILVIMYPPLLSDFNETWISSAVSRKNTQISNFMKIRPVGTELFHEEGQKVGQADGRKDGQTDMPKLIVVFRNFANGTKKSFLFSFLTLQRMKLTQQCTL